MIEPTVRHNTYEHYCKYCSRCVICHNLAATLLMYLTAEQYFTASTCIATATCVTPNTVCYNYDPLETRIGETSRCYGAEFELTCLSSANYLSVPSAGFFFC